MALLKPFETTTGADATYWRVVEIHTSWSEKIATIIVFGYVSELTRRSGKRNIEAKVYRVHGGVFDSTFSSGNLTVDNSTVSGRGVAYTYIKSLPEWVDAQDVIEVTDETV